MITKPSVLHVYTLPAADGRTELSVLAAELKQICPRQPIAFQNWNSYPNCPDVYFFMGWSNKEVILHYVVNEKRVKAEWQNINDPVYRDSCVEFFISDGEGQYFNFEFNAAAVPLAGRGSDRKGRIPLDPELLQQIRRESSLGSSAFGEKDISESWTLTAAIPLSLFSGTALEAPGGKAFRANFYKCGDDLKEPHFVTWNPVLTAEPDYHRPEYFGNLRFSSGRERL